jgi:hypothetical protein
MFVTSNGSADAQATDSTSFVGGDNHPSDIDAPTLAHKLKHDKSILALVVSSTYIYAGTEGGEILVSW